MDWLYTLALAYAALNSIGLLGSRLFRDVGRGVLAWCTGVGGCRGDEKVTGGT